MTSLKITPELKLVVYGQGSTQNRPPTLLRMSERLREELSEVAQGPFYLLVEIAVQRMIKDLKSKPPGNMEVLSAADMIGQPAQIKSAKRASRPRKPLDAV
jgi:hypothetical protein